MDVEDLDVYQRLCRLHIEVCDLSYKTRYKECIRMLNVLRGLLPICSSCKKIRDDQGYWKQVEHFVEDHSGTRFSHGICPDCMIKLYGQMMPKDEK